MDTIIILGLAYNQVPLVAKAREMGYHTVAVGKGGGFPAAAECADQWFPIDTTDKEAVLQLARQYKTAGLATSGTSTAMCTVSHVNDQLGLSDKVIPYPVAVNAVFKDKMRNLIGDLMPGGFSATDIEDAFQRSGELNYPLLIKPGDGGGGKGITVLFDGTTETFFNAFRYAQEFSRTKIVIIEEYLDGRVFGVESIVLDGHIHQLVIPEKVVTEPPRCVTLGVTFPPLITQELEEQITRINHQAIERLGIDWGATHIDIVLDRTSNPRIIDVGPRLAGGALMASMVPDAYSYDCYRAIIMMATGEAPEAPGVHNGKYYGSRFLVTPRKGILESIQYSDQIVEKLMIENIRQLKPDGSELEGLDSDSSRLMIYTTQGRSYADVVSRLDQFSKSVKIIVK